VHEQVLDVVPSESLAVLVIWEPVLRSDDERASRRATTLFDDARVTHYWAPTLALGELFQPLIGLQTEPAWDVYLLYPHGTVWSEVAPPVPHSFMHQLGGRLPDEHRLDGSELKRRLRGLLAE
jgi:hypothetical protein